MPGKNLANLIRLSDATEDPQAYRDRQIKAVERHLETEHYFTLNYISLARNRAWRKRRGNKGWTGPEKFTPPDLNTFWDEYEAEHLPRWIAQSRSEESSKSGIRAEEIELTGRVSATLGGPSGHLSPPPAEDAESFAKRTHESKFSDLKYKGGIRGTVGMGDVHADDQGQVHVAAFEKGWNDHGLVPTGDNQHHPPMNGFDIEFQQWMGDTKPGQWPLHKSCKKDLDDPGIGMMYVTHAFAMWIYRMNKCDTYKMILCAIFFSVTRNILPEFLGKITESVTEHVRCSGYSDEPKCLEQIGCVWSDKHIEGETLCHANHDTSWDLVIWVCAYAASYLAGNAVSYYFDVAADDPALRRDIRYHLMGRMLKFRPLPDPGESTFLLQQAVRDAVKYSWALVWVAFRQKIALLTSIVVVIINIDSEKWSTFWMLLLILGIPIIVMVFIVWFNYFLRRRNAHDLARRYYHWHAVLNGYLGNTVEILKDEDNYDIDKEVTSLWFLSECIYFREQSSSFWDSVTTNFVDSICFCIAMAMVYVTARSSFNGDISTGNFIAIAASILNLVPDLSNLMHLLNKKPVAYEAVLRIAKVYNNTELKQSYDKPKGGLVDAIPNRVKAKIAKLKNLRKHGKQYHQTTVMKQALQKQIETMATKDLEALRHMGTEALGEIVDDYHDEEDPDIESSVPDDEEEGTGARESKSASDHRRSSKVEQIAAHHRISAGAVEILKSAKQTLNTHTKNSGTKCSERELEVLASVLNETLNDHVEETFPK